MVEDSFKGPKQEFLRSILRCQGFICLLTKLGAIRSKLAKVATNGEQRKKYVRIEGREKLRCGEGILVLVGFRKHVM